MSQELTDAEWLRNMADVAARFQDMRTMGSVADIARLHSIADRLERPGVEASNRIQTLEHALEIVLERCPDEEPEGYDGMNPGDIRTDAVDQWTWEIGQRIRSLIQ